MIGNSQEQWPGPDDEQVIAEMLNNPNSEHWDKCREFMVWVVRREASKSFPRLLADPLEDIVQNAMLSVATNLPHFRYESRLTTWLVRISYSRTIDALRNQLRSSRTNTLLSSLAEDEDNEGEESEVIAYGYEIPTTVEDGCITREELNEVLANIEIFISTHAKSDRNRKIVRMVLFEGRTVEETAREIGVSPPVAGYVIRSLQRYLREKFRAGPA